MSNTLYLFTNRYPFGQSETFVNNEVIELSKQFVQIILVPVKISKEDVPNLDVRPLPKNVKYEIINSKVNYRKKLYEVLFKNLLFFLFELIRELFREPKYLKRKISNVNLVYQKLIHALWLSENIDYALPNKENSTFYSFWMNEGALALSILKNKGIIKEYIFKCHRYDVYDCAQAANFIPFRLYNYDSCKYIINISKGNQDYLIQNFPNYSFKMKLIYLGSDDKGKSNVIKKHNDKFLIFSCSNIIPLKRVKYIPKILSLLTNVAVHWVHAGDGVEKEAVLKYAKQLPSNVSYELLGSIPHEAVYNYYKNNAVDLFLHLSETEGLPVSMMEAISFGVPIMACDVGGVSEIVNENTGVLLPKEFEIQAVATTLEQFLLNASQNGLSKASIRNYWKDHFDHTVNVAALINLLKS